MSANTQIATSPSPELLAYRSAHADWRRLLDGAEAAILSLGEEARQTAARFCTPAKAKKLVRVDGEDGTRCALRRVYEAQYAWLKVVPKARHEELVLAWQPTGAKLMESEDEAYKARRRMELLAYEVPDVLGAPGGSWHLVRSFSPWDSSGDESTARGKCAIRYRELRQVGYEVRAVVRLPKPLDPAKPAPVYRVLTFELWAWANEEGAHLARFQAPAQTVAQYIRAFANEGLNPVAATNHAVTVEMVDAADAWLPHHDGPASLPVKWERAEYGEDMPAKWGDPSR